MIERPLPPNRRLTTPSARARALSTPDESPAPDESGRRARRGFFSRSAPRPRPESAGTGRGVALRAIAWARVLLGALVFVGVAVVAAFGLYRYVRTSPRFAVRNLEVDGAHRRTEEQIAQTAGVRVGSNVFAFDPDEAREALVADPWVERASVSRHLPGGVHIEVVEREAACLVSLGPGLFLAAPGGMIFKRFEPGDPADLVVVTGVDESEGRDGVTSLVKIAQDVIRDYERSTSSKRYPLQEVHVDEEGGLALTVGREAVVLSLGKGPYRAKLERASRVLGEIERRKAYAQAVFLDNDAHPERVVARMR